MFVINVSQMFKKSWTSERNKQFAMSENTKKRNQERMIIYGRPEKFFQE